MKTSLRTDRKNPSRKIGLAIFILLLAVLACSERGINEPPVDIRPTPTSTPSPGKAPSPTPLVIDLTAAATSTDPGSISPSPENPRSCVPDGGKEIGFVTNVVDGDTIDAIINGTEHRIRYIGMNTPETDEVLGPRASTFNSSLVKDKIITLYKDISETDRYGRLLRYVIVEDLFANYELVINGYAQSATYPPDVACASLFREAQSKARAANLGLWQETDQAMTPAAPSTPADVIEILAVHKREEYVEIQNNGAQDQDLNGWFLRSERGYQDCLLSGTIGPGEVLRIWALAEDEDKEGFNCGYGTNIWNNSEPDKAILYNSEKTVIDTYP